MRLLPVLFLLSIVFAVQGCGGGESPTRPGGAAQAKYANWSTVSRLPIGGTTVAVVDSGAYVYSVDEWGGLNGIDVGDLANVRINNVIPPSSTNGYLDLFGGISIAGDVACLVVNPGIFSGMVSVVELYDISVRNNPKFISTINADPGSILLDGRFLYICSGSLSSTKLTIIDIANPYQPKTLGSVAIQNPGKLVKHGSKVYISQVRIEGIDDNNYKCIQTVDVSDPSNPIVVGSPSNSSWSGVTYSDLVVNGNVGYTYDYRHGLYVLDLSTNSDIVLIRSLPQPDNINTIALHGSYLYAGTDSGLRIYDITTPELPTLIKTVPSATSIGFVSVGAGQGVYISDHPATMRNGASNQLNVFYMNP